MLTRRIFAKVLPFLGALTLFGKALAEVPPPIHCWNSFDARDWAKSFVAHVKLHPVIPGDEETMTTWFASALMRGYDQGRRDADEKYFDIAAQYNFVNERNLELEDQHTAMLLSGI